MWPHLWPNQWSFRSRCVRHVLIKKTAQIGIRKQFGVESCRVRSQPKARHGCMAQQIASVYPLLHERTLALYLQYLEHKGQWGKWTDTDLDVALANWKYCQATKWSSPSIGVSR